MLRTNRTLRPWKNSRLLKDPAIIPGLATMRGWRTPMADCTVAAGFSESLRHHWAPRVSTASAVAASAAPTKAAASDGMARAASAAARVQPDAMPSTAKLSGVSGVAHSRMVFTAP